MKVEGVEAALEEAGVGGGQLQLVMTSGRKNLGDMQRCWHSCLILLQGRPQGGLKLRYCKGTAAPNGDAVGSQFCGS